MGPCQLPELEHDPENVRTSANLVTGAQQTTGALFVQSTIDVTSSLRATLGLRFEAMSTTDSPDSVPGPGLTAIPQPDTTAGKSIVVPKFGLMYTLPGDVALYGNVSKGFRQDDGVIADPTVPYITVWAYEVGLKRTVGPVAGSVALFRDDISNDETVNPVTLVPENGGSSTRQGVEITFAARASSSVQLTADWTFQDARYTSNTTVAVDSADGGVAYVDLDGLRVYNTSKYVGVAALEFEPPESPWRVRLSTDATGPYSPFDEPGVVLPGYALFNLSGGVKVGDAQFEVEFRNMFDTAYRELEAGGLISPGEPRGVYGSVRYAF